MHKKTRPEPSAQTTDRNSTTRHSRARRRLLQSLAAGGAAISVKQLPEQWAKPILDVGMVPAHALASVAAVFTCEIGDVDSNGDARGLPSSDPGAPFDPPLTGDNQPGVIDLWGDIINMGLQQSFTLRPSADLDPISAGPVTLMVGGSGGALDIDSGANQTVVVDPDGDANFAAVVVEIGTPDFPFNQTVDFNFSAAGQNCEINIAFTENLI